MKKMKKLPPPLPHYPQMNLSRYLMIFFLWPALSTSCYFCAPSLSHSFSLCVGVETRNKVTEPLSGKIF